MAVMSDSELSASCPNDTTTPATLNFDSVLSSANLADSASALPRTTNILRSLLLQRPADESHQTIDCMDLPPEVRQYLMSADSAHRPRSQSMSATWWTPLRTQSAVSQDSLDSFDDSEGTRFGSVKTDGLVEVARQQLMLLSTSSDLDLDPSSGSRISASQPGSPPRLDSTTSVRPNEQRKYSEGSQLKARLQAARLGFRTPIEHALLATSGIYSTDMASRRRKKFEGVSGLPYARRVSFNSSATSNVSADEGIGDESSSERSILKSILTGRSRSNTITVCAGKPDSNSRQRVALAKKTLHPVTAKISDCMNQTVSFARSLPTFTVLPTDDQRVLMTAALHRLLLLYMAELNVEFVVTPVLRCCPQRIVAQHDTNSQTLRSADTVPGDQLSDDDVLPTLQFAEAVKNFIGKCQSLQITSGEYHLLRIITLFQTPGCVSSQTAELAGRVQNTARHDLQQLVDTTSRLQAARRYSALLFTLHSLFTINCRMLDTLFCRSLVDNPSTESSCNSRTS